MPKTNPRLVVVLSDLHAGSTYSLMPRDCEFKTREGIGIRPTPIQEWIMDCWDDCWSWFYETIAKKEPWSLIVNGDLIHGTLYNTKDIWSNNVDDHVAACYNILKEPGRKADSVYIIQGTESHTATYEDTIGNLLQGNGVNIVRPSKESSVWDSLLARFNGTLCKVDHHIATTGRPYLEASALSIHMGAERVECARAGHEVPKVFLRAHRHKFGQFSDGYGMVVITPPWVAKDRFARKVVPHAVPQIGMVVLDWRTTDDLPVVHTRLHTIKQQKVA